MTVTYPEEPWDFPDTDTDWYRVENSSNGFTIYLLPQSNPAAPRVIARYYAHSQILTIIPRDTRSNNYPRAYSRLRAIHIHCQIPLPAQGEDCLRHAQNSDVLILDGIPDGLGSILDYGLTLPKYHRYLVEAFDTVAGHPFRSILISDKQSKNERGWMLKLSFGELEDITHGIRLHVQRAGRVRARLSKGLCANIVREKAGLKIVPPSPGREHPIREISAVIDGTRELTDAAAEEILDTLSTQTWAIAEQHPRKFLHLRSEVEVVALEQVIQKYRSMLAGGVMTELEWQAFFDDNQFILQQAFAAPTRLHRREAHLSQQATDGTGQRIVDFLLENPVTKQAHLIEIKQPKMQLMRKSSSRGKGASKIYGISGDLADALAQLNSQVHATLQEFPHMKSNSESEPEAFAVSGALICGTWSALDIEQQRSLNLFRHTLHGLTILCFDELLVRLENIKASLTPPTPTDGLEAADTAPEPIN